MERDDRVLARLYESYRRAAVLGRAPRSSLAAVDRLLEARVALYRHLVASGWEPPPQVRRQLDVDAALLEERPGVVPH